MLRSWRDSQLRRHLSGSVLARDGWSGRAAGGFRSQVCAGPECAPRGGRARRLIVARRWSVPRGATGRDLRHDGLENARGGSMRSIRTVTRAGAARREYLGFSAPPAELAARHQGRSDEDALRVSQTYLDRPRPSMPDGGPRGRGLSALGVQHELRRSQITGGGRGIAPSGQTTNDAVGCARSVGGSTNFGSSGRSLVEATRGGPELE